ncbi:MAG: hypothetical protein KGJ13_03120 [Patescibacteria group bacterium]|nr:hypothetical protein [Patescibacteria group bacterium]
MGSNPPSEKINVPLEKRRTGYAIINHEGLCIIDQVRREKGFRDSRKTLEYILDRFRYLEKRSRKLRRIEGLVRRVKKIDALVKNRHIRLITELIEKAAPKK